MILPGLNGAIRWAAQGALDEAALYSIRPTITSIFRSFQEQAYLRRRWERGQSPFPANRPGDSAHNYGLAWDSVVKPGQQQTWNQIRRAWGWRVPENDVIHAEVPNWRIYVGGYR